jgi:hypothetical protein
MYPSIVILQEHTHQEGEEVEQSVDVHFEPVIKLEQIDTCTMEENETPIFQMYLLSSK